MGAVPLRSCCICIFVLAVHSFQNMSQFDRQLANLDAFLTVVLQDLTNSPCSTATAFQHSIYRHLVQDPAPPPTIPGRVILGESAMTTKAIIPCTLPVE